MLVVERPGTRKEETQWLTAKQVMTKIGFCRSKLYNMIREGEFPPPHKVGYASRWDAAAVEAWMQKYMEPAT